MPRKFNSLEERLLSYRRIDLATGCWRFTGCIRPDGYGKMGVGKRGLVEMPHRVSASLYLKLDLNNKHQQANHKDLVCSNRDCFNPEHLYVGTKSQNTFDAYNNPRKTHKNKTITHCKNGHELTEENSYRSIGYYGVQRKCKLCVYTKYHNKKMAS